MIKKAGLLAEDKQQTICCFGEVLFRFSPQLQGAFFAKASMPVFLGGAELNVATALAKWKIPSKYVTAIPDNYLSREIINEVSARNIQTNSIKLCGDRVGLYYLPQGTDLKNSGVIYDRENSSFASLKTGDINWDETFENVCWFHFSAISPALNKNTAAICLEALSAASQRNIPISIDLNYRAKLWQTQTHPVAIMKELVQYCDVIMGNIWSAESLLNIKLSTEFKHHPDDLTPYLQQADLTALAIQQSYPKCHTVANTFRFDEGQGIKYFSTLHNKEGQFVSPIYKAQSIVDKVGSGDCFMAGLIFSILQQMPYKNSINFAAAAAFLKLQQLGDATSSTIADIQKIILSYE